MARRREDPDSPEQLTLPPAPQDLTTAFSLKNATTREPGSRRQTERLPTSNSTYHPEYDEAEIFKEPVFDKLPASQLPSFEEPSFSNQPTGRNGLIFDTDDEDMVTEVAGRAANAQLRAEEARQTRQSSTKATQGGTTSGPLTRSAPQLTGAPSPKKNITFAPTPEYITSREPKGPLSYLRDHHAILEPSLPLTPQEQKDLEIDAKVMEDVSELRRFTEEFCSKYFAPQLDNFDTSDVQTFLDALKTGTKQTIYYAGAIADGGPDGLKGWVEIIRDPVFRQALVYGIIHRVLKEHVFGALLFGGPADLVKTFETLEKEQKPPLDGFIRSETRAHEIISWELANHKKLHECDERSQSIWKISLQIEKLIEPIYALQSKKEKGYKLKKNWKQSILLIVMAAGDLSVYMRRNGDSVLYHIFPVFKGQDVNLSTMDIFNYEYMSKKYMKFDTKEQASAFPLVRIICTFPLSAYRKHGGVMAERLLEKDDNTIDYGVAPELRNTPRNLYRGRVIGAKDGFRSKALTKAVVAARFGFQSGMVPRDDNDGTVELADTIKAAEAAKAATGRCGVM